MTGVRVETRRRAVSNACTSVSSLVHVTDGPRVVGRTAVGVVLELNFVGHVVEQGLNGTELSVGVVREISPFHHEDLGWVAALEGVRGRGVHVDSRGHGRGVASRKVVLHGVVHFQILDFSGPGTGSECTLASALVALLRHGGGNPAASRAAVRRDSVVEGRSNTSGSADVQSRGRVTCVQHRHGHHTGLRVGVLHSVVGEFRLESVRGWCNVTHLVGDVARVRLTAVVARTESEAAPAVGGRGAVNHVVRRGTSVGRGLGTVEVVPSVGRHAHSVSDVGGLRRVELEGPEVARDVAWNGELVGLGVTVGDRRRCLASAGQRSVDARFSTDTDGGPLVQRAVVHEDEVHSGAVLGADLQVAVAVVVPEVLVELVHNTGTGIHTVASLAGVGATASEPVTVEGARAGVETLLRTGTAARGIELKEVLVVVAVVRQLAVKVALWRVVTACVDVGGQDGHLLVRSRRIGGVHDVDLVGRGRGLRTREGWRVTNVGSVASRVQVLVLPVVAEVIAERERRSSGLEAAVGGRAAAGTDGDEFTSVKLVV